MIELTFLKELMATREANQSSAIFANIGIFLKMRLVLAARMQWMLSFIMSMNLSYIAILNINKC